MNMTDDLLSVGEMIINGLNGRFQPEYFASQV